MCTLLPCWLIDITKYKDLLIEVRVNSCRCIQEWRNVIKGTMRCNFLETFLLGASEFFRKGELPINRTFKRDSRCMLCRCSFPLRQLYVSAA